MKQKFLLKTSIFTLMTLIPVVGFGYEKDRKDDYCFKPKFREFSLPVYSADNKQEVAPESDFSFIVSHVIDPDFFKLTAKGKDLSYRLEDRNSFYVVHSKIPAELTGKFVRISSRAQALLGCYSSEGWLIKVADAEQANENSSQTQEQNTAELPPQAVTDSADQLDP